MVTSCTSWPPCRGTGPTPSSRGGAVDRSAARRRRGAPSAACTRSRAATSATCRGAPSASPGSPCSPAWAGLGAGGWWRRADAVIAMSPPLTLGLTGRLVAWSHRAPQVFNVQDVFPDAAVETGAITDRRVIAVARWLERLSYRVADAVTVLSDDLRGNVTAKLPRRPVGDGAHDPQLRRHRPHPARRPDDPVPRRARHRRRAGAPVRRQRRLLAIPRPAPGGRPAAARRDRADQRRRRGQAPSSSSGPPAWRTSASPATCPTTGSASCWRPATCTPCHFAAAWRG